MAAGSPFVSMSVTMPQIARRRLDGYLRPDPWRVPGRLDLETRRHAVACRRPSRLRADARRLRRAVAPRAARYHGRHARPGDRAAAVLRGPPRRDPGWHERRRH